MNARNGQIAASGILVIQHGKLDGEFGLLPTDTVRDEKPGQGQSKSVKATRKGQTAKHARKMRYDMGLGVRLRTGNCQVGVIDATDSVRHFASLKQYTSPT